MEQRGFEILDVQSLRPHYALTLAAWNRRYVAHRAQAAQFVSQAPCASGIGIYPDVGKNSTCGGGRFALDIRYPAEQKQRDAPDANLEREGHEGVSQLVHKSAIKI
jgi:hypothetical protein